MEIGTSASGCSAVLAQSLPVSDTAPEPALGAMSTRPRPPPFRTASWDMGMLRRSSKQPAASMTEVGFCLGAKGAEQSASQANNERQGVFGIAQAEDRVGAANCGFAPGLKECAGAGPRDHLRVTS